jgi:hypothetical protein
VTRARNRRSLRLIRRAVKRDPAGDPAPVRTLIVDRGDPERLDLITLIVPAGHTAAQRDELARVTAATIAEAGGEVLEVLNDLAQLEALTGRRGAES